MSGFSAIGLVGPKTSENVGSVMRAAMCFGAAMVVIENGRYHGSPTDVFCAWRSIPLLKVSDLREVIPHDCVPVAVEIRDGAVPLQDYVHPKRAFYVFGPEDGSLGERITSWCRDVVVIPSNRCLNLAAATNVVLYDRSAKALAKKAAS